MKKKIIINKQKKMVNFPVELIRCVFSFDNEYRLVRNRLVEVRKLSQLLRPVLRNFYFMDGRINVYSIQLAISEIQHFYYVVEYHDSLEYPYWTWELKTMSHVPYWYRRDFICSSTDHQNWS